MVSKQGCPQKEKSKGKEKQEQQQQPWAQWWSKALRCLFFARAVPCACGYVQPRTPASLRAWCGLPIAGGCVDAVARARSGEVGAADAGARAAPAAAAALPADEHRPARAPALAPAPRGGGAGRREDDHGEQREARDGDAEHDVAARDARAGLEHHAAASCHTQRPLTLPRRRELY